MINNIIDQDLASFKGYDGASIEEDDISLIRQLLKSPNALELKNPIITFENKFKEYIGIKYGFSFHKARVALISYN